MKNSSPPNKNKYNAENKEYVDWADEWFAADWTRRESLDFLAKGGLASLLAGASLSPLSAADPKDEIVRIGYLPITDATALLVAHAKGFFAAEGLESEKPTLIRSWSSLVEGFAARKFNLVHLLKPIPVWMRYNNNFPVKILAWAHVNGSGLVVDGKSNIHDFKDLGGKRLAVPYWYSMHNIVLQYALRQSGLEPVITSGELKPNQVGLQVLPPPEMPSALVAGKISGYIVAEPFNALGEIKAKARMLRFTGDIWKDHPCCVVTAHEQDTIERPEWTQKVVNAIVKAQIYTTENKQEVARLISRDETGLLPMRANILEKAMNHYHDDDYIASGAIKHQHWDVGRIEFEAWPYPSATKFIVEAMRDTLVEGDTTFLNNLDGEFVANDLVDYRFVKNALEANPQWGIGINEKTGNPYERQEIIEL